MLNILFFLFLYNQCLLHLNNILSVVMHKPYRQTMGRTVIVDQFGPGVTLLTLVLLPLIYTRVRSEPRTLCLFLSIINDTIHQRFQV